MNSFRRFRHLYHLPGGDVFRSSAHNGVIDRRRQGLAAPKEVQLRTRVTSLHSVITSILFLSESLPHSLVPGTPFTELLSAMTSLFSIVNQEQAVLIVLNVCPSILHVYLLSELVQSFTSLDILMSDGLVVWMCVWYVCARACVHACAYARMHACMHACMHASTYMYV